MTELRPTGIELLGDLPWGTHFCHFYETRQDLLDILVPFFQTGLAAGELCVWIVDPLRHEEAIAALRPAVSDLDGRLAAGDLVVASPEEWMLTDGVFAVAPALARWEAALAAAAAKGYPGLRVNGVLDWLSDEDWEEVLRYEQGLDDLLAGQRMLVACTYPLQGSRADVVFELARSHQFILARRHGESHTLEIPAFRAAKTELQRANAKLELRVEQRTHALAAANRELERQAAARGRAQEALRTAREEEGRRIARELHDELGSTLTSLKWQIEALRKRLAGASAERVVPDLDQKLESMVRLTETTLGSVRRISSELRPPILDDLGLAAAVEWQAEEFEARTRIACRCQCAFEGADPAPEQAIALFRILQEALTNVMRHAQATRVDVELRRVGGEVVLTVRDDGRGITAEQTAGQGTMGLQGMHERARLAGGAVEVTGTAGAGTTVKVRMPLAVGAEA